MAEHAKTSGPIPHRVHVVGWLRRPGRVLLRNWLAITLGRDIWTWRPLEERELRHELEHVRQWRRHGVTFAPRYLRASYRSWRAGTGWYRGNAYEVAARAAEEPPQP
jgi:hypothetical protein